MAICDGYIHFLMQSAGKGITHDHPTASICSGGIPHRVHLQGRPQSVPVTAQHQQLHQKSEAGAGRDPIHPHLAGNVAHRGRGASGTACGRYHQRAERALLSGADLPQLLFPSFLSPVHPIL